MRGAGPRHTYDPDTLLDNLDQVFGQETEFIDERFHTLANQFAKVTGYEDRMDKLTVLMKKLQGSVEKMNTNQQTVGCGHSIAISLQIS